MSIGSNTSLVAPVRVGDGALTGAGSVVTKDVAPGERVAGNPARPLPEEVMRTLAIAAVSSIVLLLRCGARGARSAERARSARRRDSRSAHAACAACVGARRSRSPGGGDSGACTGRCRGGSSVQVCSKRIALFYLWSSGRRGAIARLAAPAHPLRVERALSASVPRSRSSRASPRCLPAFYLYRVDRTMQLTDGADARVGALLDRPHADRHDRCRLIAAIVLWLVERTHQWYAYTILGILAAASAGRTRARTSTLPGSRRSSRSTVRSTPSCTPCSCAAGLAQRSACCAKRTQLIAQRRGCRAWIGRRRGASSSAETLVAGDTRPEIEYRRRLRARPRRRGATALDRADRRRHHHRLLGDRDRDRRSHRASGVTTIRSRVWRSSARCSRSSISPPSRFATRRCARTTSTPTAMRSR